MMVRVEDFPKKELPIKIIDGFKISIELDKNINCFTLYSYNRIVIHPGQDYELILPYSRDWKKFKTKYFMCELTKEMAQKNLFIMWSNINDAESERNLSFLLRNNNILLREDLNELTSIVGTGKKIDILPNKPIIRVFIN